VIATRTPPLQHAVGTLLHVAADRIQDGVHVPDAGFEMASFCNQSPGRAEFLHPINAGAEAVRLQ